MTVVTTRPNATVSSSGWTNTGGGSRHGATSDNSDSTYVTGASFDNVVLGCAEPTIPSGGLVKSVALRVRCSKVTESASLDVVVTTDGESQDDNDVVTTVSWSTPTTVTPMTLVRSTTPSAVEVRLFNVGGYSVVVHEVYVDTTYVTKPVTSVSAPTGTITTTNIPQAAWSNTLDADGGAQTAYEVKYFTAAQYGIGGFNPSSSPYTLTSGVVASSATSYTPTTPLADATYRAYVRVAQTVNGSYHWSDWQYSGFTLSVALPAAPTISLYPDLTDAVMHISVTSQTGTATTDALEIQRSTDNVTWAPVRLTTDTTGVVTGLSAYVYDFEGGNSQACWYRARALHNYSGVYAASAWVTAGPRSWQSPGVWWLKSVQNPALNMPVTVHSQQEITRPARQGRFQPLGARRAIVVSDTQGPAQGTITFRCDTDAQAAALDQLLADQGVLLLQGAPGDHWTDRYVKFGDLQRQRTSDKSYVEPTLNTLSWIEVDPPAGPITAWRVVGS